MPPENGVTQGAERRHFQLAGTYNIRDLGGYPTRTGRQTQWNRLLRADSLHRLTDETVAALVSAGVSTVIDLRNSYEVSVAPNPLSALSGINYVNLSLFDGLALATPMQAEPGIERDALRDVYIRALAERQGAVRDVLIAIADAVPGTVLFHCTVGKDRTGLIAALILSIAEVDIDHVVEDYTLTKAHIFPLLDEMIAGVKARGLDVQNFMPMLDCEPTTMRATLKHIEDRYGSVLHYLAAIGLDVNVIARLRARLLDDFADKVSPGRLR